MRACLWICVWMLLSLDGVAQTNWTLLGWNNLGMHCMDSDFSVFSILPPYNTFHAQLIDNQGRLVTNTAEIGVNYRAIAGPDGSYNANSEGKGNFWEYVGALFGVSLPENTGLPVPGPSFLMPGTNNTPRAMMFESNLNWFAAYGVPITPYDDAGRPNTYPMMRVTATNGAGSVLARADIVVPVSDEMDCKLCHASGSGPAAKPTAGWANLADPGRDYRINILRLHDERQGGNPAFIAALTNSGFNSAGLAATVVVNGHPILCAACHASEALPGSGQSGIPPLTRAMHAGHAPVIDPRNGMALGASANRLSCYSCHPGSETRCLRGAMGKAVAADGSMQMQCQSCHGGMSIVGGTNRVGWLDEPNCQACHVGGANNAFGQIRFMDAWTGSALRATADQRFATKPNTPAPGYSLYRFSTGHGGLQCAACHGSTHAEFPSAEDRDNIAPIQLQGHVGVIGECTACHHASPPTVSGGPHGMHPVGQAWLQAHKTPGETISNCRPCHGMNDRGSVLSRTFADRTIVTPDWGTKNFWRGNQIGCYTCHNGPSSSSQTTRGFPVVTNQAASTTSGIPVVISLGNAHTRIVSQPRHGVAALSNEFATYYPDATFVGEDAFTFCATNDYNDSNLGTVAVTVFAPPVAPELSGTTYVFGVHTPSGQVELALSTRLGSSYLLQRSSSVEGPWTAVTAAIWGHTDSRWIRDPSGVAGPQLFYRTVLLPTNSTRWFAAVDEGTNATYDSGWQTGSNGGFGWGGGWSLTTFGSPNAGFFMGTTGGNPNLSLPPRAWGLWAGSGATAQAERALSQPMAIGETMEVGFDNNLIAVGGSAGVSLLNEAGESLMDFYFVGGEAGYRIRDAQGSWQPGIGWTNGGLDLVFRLAAQGDYSFRAGTREIGGSLTPRADMAIVRIRFWNYSAGPNANYDLFINHLRWGHPPDSG